MTVSTECQNQLGTPSWCRPSYCDLAIRVAADVAVSHYGSRVQGSGALHGICDLESRRGEKLG